MSLITDTRLQLLDDSLLDSAEWADDPTRDKPIVIPLPAPDTDADLTGATRRQFSLGGGVLLTRYAGAMGFDQVTDWQYYRTDERTGERTPVAPRPTLDGSQPSRTRSRSGSVVRVFLAEMGGRLAGKMRSRGVDPRVLVKVSGPAASAFAGDAVNIDRISKSGFCDLHVSIEFKSTPQQRLLQLGCRCHVWCQHHIEVRGTKIKSCCYCNKD